MLARSGKEAPIVTIIIYRCEKCKRDFNNIADAKKCEKSHLKIKEAHIKSFGYGIYPHPYEIEITFNNGDKIIYVAEYLRG